MSSGIAQRKVHCWRISKLLQELRLQDEEHFRCYLRLNTDVFEAREKVFILKTCFSTLTQQQNYDLVIPSF